MNLNPVNENMTKAQKKNKKRKRNKAKPNKNGQDVEESKESTEPVVTHQLTEIAEESKSRGQSDDKLPIDDNYMHRQESAMLTVPAEHEGVNTGEALVPKLAMGKGSKPGK